MITSVDPILPLAIEGPQLVQHVVLADGDGESDDCAAQRGDSAQIDHQEETAQIRDRPETTHQCEPGRLLEHESGHQQRCILSDRSGGVIGW